MGHNDGGSLTPTDNGRTDCPGQAAQICYSEYASVNETIYTFAATLEWATALYLAKGAKVILSSQTPDNTWETGTYTYAPNRFEYYPWFVPPFRLKPLSQGSGFVLWKPFVTDHTLQVCRLSARRARERRLLRLARRLHGAGATRPRGDGHRRQLPSRPHGKCPPPGVTRLGP